MGKKWAIFRKFQGVTLSVLGGVMLAGAFFGLYYKISHTRSFASYLPADSTVFFLEGDLESAARYVPLDRRRLAADLFNVHSLNFLTDVQSWLGQEGGIALIKDKNSDAAPVYFFSVNPLQIAAARRFDATHDDAVLIGRYMVQSRSANTLEIVRNGRDDGLTMLDADPSFSRVSHNLSVFRLAFFYIQPRFAVQTLLELEPFTDMGPLGELIRPLGDAFRGIGGNIIGDENGLFVQTYTSAESFSLAGGGFHMPRLYGAQLFSHIPADSLIAVFGGRGVVFSDTMKSMLVAPFDAYYEDIAGLLDDEYALGLYDGHYSAAVYLDDGDEDMARVRSLHDVLVKFGGIFAPSERVFTLPDGTKGRELVANPDNVAVRCEKRTRDCPVTEIDMAGQDWGIYYTVSDSALIFATDKELLDRALRADASVWYDEGYRRDLDKVIGSGNEAYIVNLEAMKAKFGPDHPLGRLIAPLPFATVTSSKNRFADGVSTIHYFKKKTFE